jgi:hypothetical protein
VLLPLCEHGQDFQSDDDKILYIMSYLQGSAKQCFKLNLYNQNPRPPPAWHNNFMLFIKELTDNFGPQDPIGDAESGIESLWMKSSDKISTYIIAFD